MATREEDARELSDEMRLAALEFLLVIILADYFNRHPDKLGISDNITGVSKDLATAFAKRMLKIHPELPQEDVEKVAREQFYDLEIGIKRLILRAIEASQVNGTNDDQRPLG